MVAEIRFGTASRQVFDQGHVGRRVIQAKGPIASTTRRSLQQILDQRFMRLLAIPWTLFTKLEPIDSIGPFRYRLIGKLRDMISQVISIDDSGASTWCVDALIKRPNMENDYWFVARRRLEGQFHI